MKKLKTNHLQVLVDDDMQRSLNRLINIVALETDTKPQSVSSFVRDLINREIQQYETELHFYNKNTYNKANKI